MSKTSSNKKLYTVIFLVLAIIYTLIIFQDRIPVNTPVDEDSFSVIVLPDTQIYSESYPEIFCNQTKWIVKNLDSLNIVFVSQLGDIVNNSTEKEWRNASRCMGVLDGKVPYGIIPGNHDTDIPSNKESGFSKYDKFFPSSRFAGTDWYKGSFENNRNNYQIINVNGFEILFLNLEIEPSDRAIAWAESVLKRNRNVYTILTTHKYLPDDSKVLDQKRSFSLDGNTGQEIWDKLVYNNCSVKMVWNGHYHATDGENRLDAENICGDTVYQIMQDYQTRENGGNGLLRIYNFMPSTGKIVVQTYSPYINEYEMDASSLFSLDLKF